ncbi:MAG TPA: TonB-dependent receptor [Bacteroidales bacterium]|nr:TonB-dependent receptor [Bacteroidales bacterium]
MKKFFMFLLVIAVSLPMAAQKKTSGYLINGQIVETQTGKSVPYATVILANDTIKVKKALACDAAGKFSFKTDTASYYTLTVSSVGYTGVTMPLKISDRVTNIGEIAISEGVELKEVKVTAQKPLVKIDVDKIVYSMESDPESQTNNTLDMLRKVPLVTVDADENITVNGQSNFKVLINGKSSNMMSSNLKEVLKSFPANTIKDIEVITNPSSKYDAEGVGGIINIITNKKTINGYNGSVSMGVNTRGSQNGSLYLATKIKKFSFSMRYFESQFRQPESTAESNGEYFNSSDYKYSTSNSKYSYKGISNGVTAEASFEIDTFNLVSMSFWGYGGNYRSESNSGTQYLNSSEEISRLYNTLYITKQSFGALSGNIDYQRTYKKPDKSLTFSYKLENEPQKSRNTSFINGVVSYPSYKLESDNDAVGREQTLQIDYYNPVTEKHQIEGGVKGILRQNTSDVEGYRNDTVKLTNTNDLDYNQYILGMYGGYVFKYKKISTKAGFRMEHTWNDGVSMVSDVKTNFTNKLFNVVPYLNFTYMPKQGHTIKTSYTQRLSRPGIWYLNPYVNNIDSMNISYGNPSLKSEISNSFELSYSYFTPKFNLSASTSASFTNNAIEQISSIQDNGGKVTTYKNIGKDQRYGMNVYSSYRPSAKYNIYFNGNVRYSKLEANNGYAISNDGFGYQAMVGARCVLWKDGSVSLNGMVYSPDVMLQGKSSGYYYTSLGVSQYFLKRKLTLSLAVADPLWKNKTFTSEYKDITFRSHSEQTQNSRYARLSLTYNFGKMNTEVKKARRGINNDDVKSGGNNQSKE